MIQMAHDHDESLESKLAQAANESFEESYPMNLSETLGGAICEGLQANPGASSKQQGRRYSGHSVHPFVHSSTSWH